MLFTARYEACKEIPLNLHVSISTDFVKVTIVCRKVKLDSSKYPSCIRTRNQSPQFTRVVELVLVLFAFIFSSLIQYLDRYCYNMRIPMLTLKPTLLCRQRPNYEEPGTATCKRLMTKPYEIQSFPII